MKRRPWSLVFLSIFHVFAPVGNIIMNAQLTGRNVLDYFALAMTPAYLSKNWIIIVAPIIAGVAIYACKKWSFYVYILAIASLFIFSVFGFQSKAGAIGYLPLLLVFLVNISVVVYFLIPAVRNIYFDSRMRWWEAKPRYSCEFKAHWNFEDNDVVHEGVIGNISVNGLFLKSDIYPRDEDIVEITLSFDEHPPVQLTGQVVFHKAAKKLGFGVQFDHSKDSRQFVTAVTQDLESKGHRIQSMNLKPEDSLTFWLRTLFTTGKGIVPKSKTS